MVRDTVISGKVRHVWVWFVVWCGELRLVLASYGEVRRGGLRNGPARQMGA
jgi:hypothetical protein